MTASTMVVRRRGPRGQADGQGPRSAASRGSSTRSCRPPAYGESPPRTPGPRDRRCERWAAGRRRFSPGCRYYCCYSRPGRSSGRASAPQERDDGVLPVLRRAADRVEGAEAARRARRPHTGRASRSRNISPISSDSELSIVVWFAQPTRCEMQIGIESGRDRVPKVRRNCLAAAAGPDVVAGQRRPRPVEDDQVVTVAGLLCLRRRGPRLLVPVLAVNDRREALAPRSASRSSRR